MSDKVENFAEEPIRSWTLHIWKDVSRVTITDNYESVIVLTKREAYNLARKILQRIPNEPKP